MPKKEDLEKIVRGKGLDALRPTVEPCSSTKITSETKESKNKLDASFANSKEETAKEQSIAEKKLNENTMIMRNR